MGKRLVAVLLEGLGLIRPHSLFEKGAKEAALRLEHTLLRAWRGMLSSLSNQRPWLVTFLAWHFWLAFAAAFMAMSIVGDTFAVAGMLPQCAVLLLAFSVKDLRLGRGNWSSF